MSKREQIHERPNEKEGKWVIYWVIAKWQIYQDVVFKILLCMLLTGLIGYNREKNGTPIGIRTHILVGFSAVIVQVTALRYVSGGCQSDHLRLAGQFLSGIAFLGTGTIMKEKGNIRGLTSASSIFFAACIGLSVGTGMYIEAILVTLAAYAFLSDVIRIKHLLRSKGNRTFSINVELRGNCKHCQEEIEKKLLEIHVKIETLEIQMISIEKSKVFFKVMAKEEISSNDILMKMMAIDSVIKVELLQG